MPIVSTTRMGPKTVVNVVFVEGEDGAEACCKELTAKYAAKKKPVKSPLASKGKSPKAK